MVASGSRTMIAGSLSSCIAGFLLSCRFSQSSGPRHSCVGTGPAFAYMRRRESRGFFVIKHSLLPFKRLTRAQACIDGTDGPLLGRDERSTPGARRVAPGREGLTVKAGAKPQWCQAITPQV